MVRTADRILSDPLIDMDGVEIDFEEAKEYYVFFSLILIPNDSFIYLKLVYFPMNP